MTVLIVSMAADWSAQQVTAHLADRGVPHTHLDTGRFPAHATLAARSGATWTGHLTLDDGPAVDLAAVTAVYYRRPTDFTLPDGMSGPEQRFARSQARAAVGGILASVDAHWINHPSALADAEYKPRQLAIAARCGFTVPPTLITNDPDAVRTFAAEVGQVVVKPLDDPVVAENDDHTIMYTRRVTRNDLRELTGVRHTAHLFQAWVPKAYEVRLTVVGETMFAVAIHAESDAAHVDWRSDYDHHRYDIIGVPTAKADAAQRYLSMSGLVYGAFDFAVDAGGRWHFLECNSGGQWGWLAELLDLPIAAAIADSLTKESR
jgi:ATP-grasp ribosomal peptide maturase